MKPVQNMVWVINVCVEAVFTVVLLHDSFLARSVLRIRIKMKALTLCSQKRWGNTHLSSSLSSARMLLLRASHGIFGNGFGT